MLYYKATQYNNGYGKNLVVNNELLTPKEFNKHNDKNKALFVPVQINKNKIYWFFGARFEMRG
jgi:hypothetical protein